MIRINRNKAALFILRLSLAVVFIYAAIASFVNPTAWIGFMPQILRTIIPANILLGIFSVYELALAAWLMSGRKTFYASSISALTFLGIGVFNLGSIDIVFRDFGLFFAAMALALMSYKAR